MPRRYAFGLIAWCLFSLRADGWDDGFGNLPNKISVCRNVMAGLRPDLGALRGDVPGELVTLIERCWAQESHVRPRAKEAADELDALLARVRRGVATFWGVGSSLTHRAA